MSEGTLGEGFQFEVIDSHIHLFSSLERCDKLNWLHEGHALYSPHRLKDYQRCAPSVSSVIFVECDTVVEKDFLAHFEEFRDAASYDEVKAIVAWAPMDSLEHLQSYLTDIRQIDSGQLLRGFRVLLQDKEDGYCLRPSFIDCIRHLGRIGLLFEIGIDVHTRGAVQLTDALSLIEQCSDTNFVVNHLAKPDLSTGVDSQYQILMQRIAAHRNVSMKLSGGFSELSDDDVLPHDNLAQYVRLNLALFGSDRLLFGSDWPVLTMSKAAVDKSARGWFLLCVKLLQEQGLTASSMQDIFARNARRIYALS